MLLGDELDSDVQTYIRTLSKSGAVINTAICIALAEGIVHANDKHLLSCDGGPISLKNLKKQGIFKYNANIMKTKDVNED